MVTGKTRTWPLASYQPPPPKPPRNEPPAAEARPRGSVRRMIRSLLKL